MSRKLAIGFQERLAEVEAYLEFLSIMEAQAQEGPPRIAGAEHPITTQQQRILYSSVYLQLYNLVEATMSRCIEAVSAAAKEHAQWKPGDLSDSMRREWVRVTARTHVELTPENRLTSALKLCEHLVASLPISAFDIEKGGGGNWDDLEIEAFSKRLGFQLVVSQPVYSAIKQRYRDDLEPVQNLRRRGDHWRMRKKTYPSDVTREQFERIRPLLEGARKQTRPRQVDLYEVFCAVLYLLRTGCQWRALPSDFPKWRTVHAYFTIWREVDEEGKSLLERALKKSGWRGPRETGAERLAKLLDRRRTEREEQ